MSKEEDLEKEKESLKELLIESKKCLEETLPLLKAYSGGAWAEGVTRIEKILDKLQKTKL